jgi:hypothetical protein
VQIRPDFVESRRLAVESKSVYCRFGQISLRVDVSLLRVKVYSAEMGPEHDERRHIAVDC